MRRCLTLYIVLSYVLTFISIGSEVAAMNKKALLIIASKDFRDEELLQPKEILEKNAIKVTIASSTLKESKGTLGAVVKPDITIAMVNVEDYDLVVFVGGGGAVEYWNNPTAHKIATDTLNSGKILGAICIAPVILANAGVLKGKRATVWASQAKDIIAKGAIYAGRDVEVDGNIITASGPKAARYFGKALVEALSK